MGEGPQEGAARPLRTPSWHQPGDADTGRRSVQVTAHQRRLTFSLLAVPASSLLGLALPTFGLDPLIGFSMWAANFWGGLVFTAATVALVYFVLGTRLDRVESWIVMALGTTLIYILSFSLTHVSLLPGVPGTGFFDLKMMIDRDVVTNVLYWGWPGIVGSAFFVWAVRPRIDSGGVR